MSVPLTYASVTGLIDHAILHPAFTDDDIRAQCRSLRAHPLASVCIKPYAVKMVVDLLAGTPIQTGTVIGFPHGSPATSVKAAEAERAFLDGVADVDMVVNVGKVLSGDWNYVRDDIQAVTQVARRHRGIVKVIFETDYLTADDPKIRLCELCSELEVDFVKTSTGFGYVKQPGGQYDYRGATEHDVALMRKHSAAGVGVKPSGGIKSLDQVVRFIELGATRIGTAATLAICEEARRRWPE
ncbi:MAG: deoxyribose-phosphate aldolase [Phycisphaerales bacterium]